MSDNVFDKKPSECNYSFVQHTKCEFFPCHATSHPEDFNCLFCYGGESRYAESGIKDCSACMLPHGRGSYEYIMGKFPLLSALAKRNR